MAEPLGATTSKSGARTYIDPPTGNRLRSVTTILSVINKPALPPWYAKMAGQRAVSEFDELRNRLEEAKTAAQREKVRMWVSGAAREYTSAAGIKGTAVHDIAEGKINGENPDVPDDLVPYVNGYLKFVEDHGPQFKFTETTFVNRTLQYAGTADFGASLWSTFGAVVIGDWKTGNTGPYLEWGYQLTAYAYAEATLVKGPGGVVQLGEMPNVSRDKAAIVRLLPGRYELHWAGDIFPMDTLWAGFKAAVVLDRIATATAKEGVFQRG